MLVGAPILSHLSQCGSHVGHCNSSSPPQSVWVTCGSLQPLISSSVSVGHMLFTVHSLSHFNQCGSNVCHCNPLSPLQSVWVTCGSLQPSSPPQSVWVTCGSLHTSFPTSVIAGHNWNTAQVIVGRKSVLHFHPLNYSRRVSLKSPISTPISVHMPTRSITLAE